MTKTDRLESLKIALPKAPVPVGDYVAYKKTGNLIFISGQVSFDIKGKLIKGKIGSDLTLEEGQKAAHSCAVNIVSQLSDACDGDLNKIKNCIKITGYVNSNDNFIDQPKVINGASEIISKLLDTEELHTRAAISSNSLPLGVSVEVDAIFEIK